MNIDWFTGALAYGILIYVVAISLALLLLYCVIRVGVARGMRGLRFIGGPFASGAASHDGCTHAGRGHNSTR